MRLFFLPLVLIFWLSGLFCIACQKAGASDDSTETKKETAISDVPDWSKEVVWYQIFVERFRNGDTSNDPKVSDIKGNFTDYVPKKWRLTPWTQDWYQPDEYFGELDGKKTLNGYPIDNFGAKAQLRRYGGDLQGVLDKIDYLEELGVTAIYFNPLNDAPSLHKYDPRHWRHIDRNFGPDPAADIKMIAEEIPHEPSTWQFTHADNLFLKVIDELHKKNIRVILDYSWNHTGKEFWALKDVKEKGEESKFADWYDIKEFDDPETPENEFDYKGWAGVPSLPEIKKTVDRHGITAVQAHRGDLKSEAARQHIFNVSKRWLDPNNDGDPSDGVDGFRLDVAGEVGLDFWQAYRKEIRAVNPDAYLVGEIWWEQWPDKLLDPKPFLEGDVFDAVMNYRWYRSARHFFNRSPNKITVAEFVDSLQSYSSGLRKQNNYAMMNLTASHDVPRFSTSIFNKNKYKVGTNPSTENKYKIHEPDAETYETMRLILVQQFTYVGAPHIWAGDEMGMWGSDDPNCRKPLIWKDYDFEPESHHPFGEERPVDEVKFNDELFQFYQKLIRLRKANPILTGGDIEYILIDDENETLAYRRYDENEEMIVVFNASNNSKSVELPKKGDHDYRDILFQNELENNQAKILVQLPARSSAVLK